MKENILSSNEVFAKAREIGPAVWLLTLYWAATARKPEIEPWFVVMNGNSIVDEDVARFFCVSKFTAERWRKRLVKTGFVKAVRSSLGGYQLYVQRPPFAMAVVRTLQTHSEARDPWVNLATEVVH